jgi:hypothetical protein
VWEFGVWSLEEDEELEEGLSERMDHAADFFELLEEGGKRREWSVGGDLEQNVGGLKNGTASVVEELGKLGFGMATRSFGDVVGDAENGTAELLCLTEAFAGFELCGELK